MITFARPYPLQAECTATGASWFRERLGRIVDVPQHGPSVIQRVDHVTSEQPPRFFVTVLPVAANEWTFVEPIDACAY
jgi:hypothetical protein